MNKNKGLLLVFATAIISGFSIFINKFGVSVIDPYIFAGLKNTVVAVLLLALLLGVKDWKALKDLRKKQWITLFFIGLVGGSIPFLLFFKGLTLTTGAQAAFLHKTMFLYVALMAVLFLKEKIHKNIIIGGLLLLLGNAFLLKFIPHSLGRGDLLILLAAMFWAGENVISKYALRTLSGRVVAWGRMFFGSVLIMIFLIISGQISLIATLNGSQIGWVFITALFLFGYVLTWYSGLKYIPVSLAAPVLMLGLPITTLLSLIDLGKLPQLNQFFGFILVGIGFGFLVGFKYFKRRPKKLIYVRT